MTQVVWLHPTKVNATPTAPLTVINNGPGTVYYRSDDLFVSSATNDGSIAENSEHEFTQRASIITKSGEVADVRIIASPSPVVPGRRLIEAVIGTMKEGETVGTYLFPAGNETLLKATALKVETTEKSLSLFWYDPALHTFRSKPTRLVLEGIVTTNAVAPAATFKFGLYKVEKNEGAEKKSATTVEAVVATSVAAVTTPAAESTVHAEAQFSSGALAAGLYALGVETITATTAAKSHENVFANLYDFSGEA